MTSTDWTNVTVDEQINQANASARTPVVFVHGLWLLRSSWNRWAGVFDQAGYAAVTPEWPDDPETVAEANAHPEVFAHKTVGQVADHFEDLIGKLDRKPGVVGHSFGAVIGAGPGLNEAQRRAVAHGTGPLLIVAGAGTGKTRVLVERYRRLRQEGIGAERILLLTFTEKAAREVLDRVEREDYLPAGERYVLTYHAFAQRFLQEEGWLCGITRGYRMVSEVRKWELMRDVLFDRRPRRLFHAQRPYERIADLLKLVERLKQELIAPAEFTAWAAWSG